MNNKRFYLSSTINNLSHDLIGNYFSSHHSNCSNNVRNEFFHAIFEWDPSWLFDNQYKKKTPTKIESQIVSPAKLIYSNYSEYKKIMLPFLINELWYTLRNDISENLKKEKLEKKITGHEVDSSFESIKNYSGKITRFNLVVTVPYYEKFDDKHPNRGDLVVLKNPFRISDQFAYIEDVKRRGTPKSETILTFVLITKYIHHHNYYNNSHNSWSLTTVTSISSSLTLVDALDNICKSPLINSILQPSCESFKLSTVETVSTVLGQLEILSRVVATVESQTPGICLIQGPPGTGKSTVIKNIVACLLSRKKVGRILVCAPSNKAVDELVIKLLDLQQKIKDRGIPFKIVRVGCEERIDDKVKCVSLTNFKKLNHQNNLSGSNKEQEIEKCIRSANIIACTLTSSRTNNRIQSVFGSSEAQISFCVIDEAAQATELLTLLPTLLGIERLILVGDPQQLPPTVLSQKAIAYRYDLSLFVRAQIIFKDELRNPILMLDTQYRMVDAISQWPNNYFYQGALKNAASVVALDICNYRVINHSYLQCYDKHSNGYSNAKEAKLVVKIVRVAIEKIQLKKLSKKISIGVITPYQNQCTKLNELLLITLKNGMSSQLVTIEINTVDSFQGSECDIIIFSCVRSNGIGFVEDLNRLNVSLTRAKHTLIVCGNFNTFRRNKMWRNLLDDAQSRGVYKDISKPNQVESILNDIISDDTVNNDSINFYDHFKNVAQFYNDNYNVFKMIIGIYQIFFVVFKLFHSLFTRSWNSF